MTAKSLALGSIESIVFAVRARFVASVGEASYVYSSNWYIVPSPLISSCTRGASDSAATVLIEIGCAAFGELSLQPYTHRALNTVRTIRQHLPHMLSLCSATLLICRIFLQIPSFIFHSPIDKCA